MCGLIGFVSYKREEELIKELVNSVSHRGPDEQDYKIIENENMFIHFGSARLSVVGENTGKMPMADQFFNMLVYNGELYNLKKLKNNIDKKITSSSDTLHLFEFLKNGGEKNLKELNGMFAFGFFNSIEKKIILGRDKLGIKPLYYFESKEYPLVFSSEIKPLLDFGFSNKVVNQKTIESYLFFGGFNKYTHLIKDVKCIPPGSSLTWNKNKLEIINYYYPEKLNKKKSTASLEGLLTEVIDDQLRADVSVDLLLSGGIDSSIIAYIAKNNLGKKVKAFSLSFTNQRYDESYKSKKISRELSLDHEVFEFDSDQNEIIISELINKLPEPIGDPSIIPTYYLSKCVSQHSKAVLTGDGADELFSGYDWYRALKFSSLLDSRFSNTLKLIARISDFIFKNQNISTSDKINLFLSGKKYKDETRLLHWQNTFKVNENSDNVFGDYLKNLELSSVNNKYDLAQLIDINTYLYTNILKKSDTASMLNGLEARPVFLDDRILEYSLSSNQTENIGIFKSKIELRKLANNFTSINNQKKQGFSHDFSSWVRNNGIVYLQSIKKDHELVSKYLQHVEDQSINNSLLDRNVWKLFSLYKWLEVNGVNLEIE